MEQEIDLRPYAQAVVRQWRLILGVLVVMLATAVALTLTLPREATAYAQVLVVAQTPQLNIDSRFYDRDATMFTNANYQRQALISLATSPELAGRAAEKLGVNAIGASALLGRIEVESPSDLIEVTARGATREEAQRLAEVWVATYQELVGELYNGATERLTQVEVGLADARQRFDQSQTELDTFYASGELIRATYEVTRLTGLVLGGAEAQVSLYTSHLTRTQELNLILEDARALQAQYEAGAQSDLSGALAALALRARLAGDEQLPIQLSFTSAESFAQGEAAAADLARFVAVLEAEYQRMIDQAGALAASIAAGDTSAVGLPAETRREYEDELGAARAALARAEGVEQRLIQDRKLALTAIEVLQNRANELQVEEALVQVQLRGVSITSAPAAGVLPTLVRNSVLAAVAGVLLGVILALVRELARRLMHPGRGGEGAQISPPAPEPVGRSSASD